MRTSLLFRHACILAVLTALALPVSAGPFGKKSSSNKKTDKPAKASKTKAGARYVSPFAVEPGLDFSALYADGKTDAEKVDLAIQWGDCAWLYAYTLRPDADKALVAKAKSTISMYGTAGNVASLRTGRMAAQVRKVPREIQDGVFDKPADYLPAVVSALVGTGGASLGNVKILHDWICDNIAYDADMLFSGKISGQDWASVLKKKKAVCSGYTNLMNEMCRLADIESAGVSGWSKGFGYKGYLDDYTDHAWNAVHIGNRWYLVDCTWDAGIVEHKTFVKKYSTSWLFASPRVFLYSHLSEKDDLQYYAPVLTKEQFVKEPYVEPDFFDFGFAFKAPMPDYTTVISGPAEYQLSLAGSGKAVSAQLFLENGGGNVPQSIWIERSNGSVNLSLDVPDKEKYKVCLFAYNIAETRWPFYFGKQEFEENIVPRTKGLWWQKKISETERGLFMRSFVEVPENGRYYFAEDQFDTERNNAVDKIFRLLAGVNSDGIKPIFSFDIVSDGTYDGYGKGIPKYPEAFPSYAEFSSTRLISPLAGSLKAGENVRFEIDSDDFTAMAIVDGVSEDSAIALGDIVLTHTSHMKKANGYSIYKGWA